MNPIDSYGIPRDSYRFLRDSYDFYKFIQIPIDSYETYDSGTPRIPIDSCPKNRGWKNREST